MDEWEEIKKELKGIKGIDINMGELDKSIDEIVYEDLKTGLVIRKFKEWYERVNHSIPKKKKDG